MNNFNEYQYQDFLIRGQDFYAASKYKIILEYLKKSGVRKILNVGCGSGELSYLLSAAGYEVLGIDPSPQYIALAKQNLPAGLETRCSFLTASVEDLPEDGSYDSVVSTDVLEHIEDDDRALKKIAALARPGGGIIITVPAGPWLFGYHDEQLGHFRRYTAKALRRLASKITTIRVDKIRYFGFTMIPICFIFSKILRKPYPFAAFGNRKNYLKEIVLHLLLIIDRRIPLPFGTSLIFFAVKEQKQFGIDNEGFSC